MPPQIVALKGTHNPLWGCRAWDGVVRVMSGFGLNTGINMNSNLDTGYAMNLSPFAPLPDSSNTGFNANTIECTVGGFPSVGWYVPMTKWKQPSQRCLVYDSITVLGACPTSWPWWYTPTMPAFPDGALFTPDYNRHGKDIGKNNATDPTLNVLFCDTHATTVSAEQAFTAIRMIPTQ